MKFGLLMLPNPAGSTDMIRLVKMGEGEYSFAEIPPNADFICEVNGEVVNYVTKFGAPVLVGDDLSYTAEFMGDESQSATLGCDTAAHLFLDEHCRSSFFGIPIYCSNAALTS